MLLKMLKRHGFQELQDREILDVGCGYGANLRRFIDYGALPHNLWGTDLLPDRIARARSLNPGIDFRCGNSEELPYDDGSFDIVTQVTVFTSILDSNMKQNIAREMLRVLKPDGIILWYDYHMNNPQNPDVRGVGRNEVHELFPGCDIFLKKVTLAPPLARRLVPWSWTLAYLLESIPLLCTHYLGVICRQGVEAKP